MKGLVLLILLVVVGCGQVDKAANIDKQTNPPTTSQTSPETPVPYPSLAVTSSANLPDCDAARDGVLAYADKEKQFYHCTEKSWIELVIKGVDGLSGTDGVNGTNGTNGVNGAKGVDGTSGTNGTNGVNGIDGQVIVAERNLTGFSLGDGGGATNVTLDSGHYVRYYHGGGMLYLQGRYTITIGGTPVTIGYSHTLYMPQEGSVWWIPLVGDARIKVTSNGSINGLNGGLVTTANPSPQLPMW